MALFNSLGEGGVFTVLYLSVSDGKHVCGEETLGCQGVLVRK